MIEQDLGKEAASRVAHDDRGVLQLAYDVLKVFDNPRDSQSLNRGGKKLGRERGFETDFERLSFLARICERVGSRISAKKALHIYQHVNFQYGNL
jgi:hypothetical protein